MVKDQDNIHVYGSDDDTVWLADLGTTLPTTLAAPAAGFEDVGFLGEDGIDYNRDASVQEFRAHQGGKVVRKKVTQSGKTITFRMIEDNDIAKELTGDLVSSTTASGITTDVISDSSAVVVKAAVIDLYDDGQMVRRVIPRLEIVVTGTEKWANSDITVLECTGTIIGNHTRITGPAPA